MSPRRSTRDAIVDAARTLFAERGYTATTIKDVAELAGYSPAMVMKTTGSKAELYAAAAPTLPSAADDSHVCEDETVGYRLVRNIVERRDSGESEPWVMMPLLIHEAPDRDAASADARERYVRGIAAKIGDETERKLPTQMVVSVLLGLAGGLRTVGLLTPDDLDADDLVRRYGAVVQSIVDGIGAR
ncbi:TetR/AcrR family transcriptional regulator [Prescottella subtropica]|uniref:TetR/AcrR family transcriptional regulator n=1 Tax=Prescottella subtropica TaxID=2545757 RepID=UPI0010F88135|nr:TetR/AcrR family transcriptional regulator [Prescottella subtropica]